MKYYSTLLTVFLSTFFYINVHAQSSVKDKIVGCWKLDKIEFADPQNAPKDMPEIPESVVCLQKDGKFVTTSDGNTVTGIYMISDDGKSMTQRMIGGTDDTGDITLLTDTALELTTSEVIIKMTRVKE